jgi:nucleoside phosphorylase
MQMEISAVHVMNQHHAAASPSYHPCELFFCSQVESHHIMTSKMASTQPPKDRNSFRVAIVCALPREADAVSLLFDEFWDETGDPYGREDSDTNIYITGRIGNHNVVLTILPGMGTNNATAASVNLRASYTGLRLVLLVGICGGLPRIAERDAFLGDVVVSKQIIEYDNMLDDTIGRPNTDIRTLLAVLETEFMTQRLKKAAAIHLKELQQEAKQQMRRAEYHYPGAKNDVIYPPEYSHKHRDSCTACADDSIFFCKTAFKSSCAEVGCEPDKLITRKHREDLPEGADFSPEIFIGRIGSGNTVMKSGLDRDQIAARHDLIAFEMEGAGLWDEVPCIIVKGICDYADSHKNKTWQNLAAATAASVAKAILGRYPSSSNGQYSGPPSGMISSSSMVQN